jgi:hypothetical protein
MIITENGISRKNIGTITACIDTGGDRKWSIPTKVALDSSVKLSNNLVSIEMVFSNNCKTVKLDKENALLLVNILNKWIAE